MQIKFHPMAREPDANYLFFNITGGLRAWRNAPNKWHFGPVSYNGNPCIIGPLETTKINEIISQCHLRKFHATHKVVNNGESFIHARPLVGDRHQHNQSPKDSWRNISANITKQRLDAYPQSLNPLSTDEAKDIKDKKTEVEKCADHISDSLYGMDISIAAIHELYHIQLINRIRGNKNPDDLVASMCDAEMFAHIHSFFLQFGAARDYLGKLIAIQCGLSPKIDAMRDLLGNKGKLRESHVRDNKIVNLLYREGNISERPNSEKFEYSGWLKEATDLRNLFVHKRPFGSLTKEQLGKLVRVGNDPDIYRYFLPICLDKDGDFDALEVISDFYCKCSDLFLKAAIASGENTQITTLTEKDIKNFTIHERR